jgi:glutaredoxin 3
MDITVYSTTTCSTCHILTEWLDKQGLAYTKKVADEDPAVMMEFMGVNDGMIGVPFTVIQYDDGRQVKFSGYDIAQLKSLLNE